MCHFEGILAEANAKESRLKFVQFEKRKGA
jgi:hypothetical protein